MRLLTPVKIVTIRKDLNETGTSWGRVKSEALNTFGWRSLCNCAGLRFLSDAMSY
jgi:hypothetical protein